MPVPLSLSAAIAIAKPLVGKGIDAVKRQFPLYPLFWKHFQKTLENNTNIDWKAVKDGCYMEPSFIGIANGLIDGKRDAEKQLRAHIEGLSFLSSEAYKERGTVLQEIVDAALEAANKAPRDDRAAAFAESRKLRQAQDSLAEQIEEGNKSLREEIREIRSAKTPPTDEAKAALDASEVEQSNLTPGPGISEEALERIVRTAQQEGVREIKEGVRAEIREAMGEVNVTATSETVVDVVGPAGTAATDAERLLDRLRADGEGAAASQLKKILSEEGTAGILRLLRRRKGPSSSLALAVEARLVADDGHFRDAEEAYQRASRVDGTSDGERARQLIRASLMADVQGAHDRKQAHIEAAKKAAADHPTVLMAEARQAAEPEESLKLLESVEPETDADRAMLHIQRAQAYIGLDDLDVASREADAAAEADPEHSGAKEIKAILPWVRARQEFASDGTPDSKPLVEAAETFVGIAEKLQVQGRPEDHARLIGRAVECYALADEVEKGVALLEEIGDPDLLPLEARADLANAAIVARRPDLALSLGPKAEEEGDEAALIRANAQMMGDFGKAARAKAAKVLKRSLSLDDARLLANAALSLLIGSAFYADVPWDEEAFEILKADHPDDAAVLRSNRLWTEGKKKEADQPLLGLSGDLKAARQLRDFAAMREEWDTAVDRAREVIKLSGETEDELAYAETLRKSGASRDAREKFLAVARDDSIMAELRGKAFEGAAQSLDRPDDFTALHDLTEEWHHSLPADANGLWNYLFSLARLARHEAAYEVVEKEEPTADIPNRAVLLAEIYYQAAEPGEAVRKIAALSDQFGRREEPLEGTLIMASLRAEQAGVELPPDLRDRVRDTWGSFKDRFPDSQAIQVIEVPKTADGIAKLFEDLSGDSIKRQKEVGEGITNGHLPVNALTAVSPVGDVITTWSRLIRLPLSLATEQTDAADREAARAAIGGAAVWDSSALYVAGGLQQDAVERIIGALPGSVIVNETLEDAVLASTSVGGSGPEGRTVFDPDTGAFVGLQETPEAVIERERRAGEGTLALARRFDARPAAPEDAEDVLQKIHEIEPLKAVASSVMLAKEIGRALYSDDRWIRELARTVGVPAFGTLALVEELALADVITPGQREDARKRLISSGGWGVCPAAEEMIDLGRAADFALSWELAFAVQDRAAWRGKPADHMRSVLALLQEVRLVKPELFELWVERAIDASRMAHPELADAWAPAALLAVAWEAGEDNPTITDETFRALVQVVKQLPSVRASGGDPVIDALNWLLSMFATAPNDLRFAIFIQIVRRLPSLDAARAWQRVVT